MARIIIRSLLILLVLYLLGKLFLDHNGLLKQFQVQRMNTDEELSIDSLEYILQQKKEERSRLLRDTLYIEQLARTKFGMSRPGEIIFQFLPPQDSLRKDSTHPPTTDADSK